MIADCWLGEEQCVGSFELCVADCDAYADWSDRKGFSALKDAYPGQDWNEGVFTRLKLYICSFLLLGVKSKNPLPTLEGSIQNVELKYCGTSLVKCASGTVGSIKICAKAPGDGGKEKLIPLIQGPSDTRDLHSSKWLNESRKPESLLAPDLVAFTIQIPQYMDYCHNSGAVLLSSVQGLAINVDPVLYTWLMYQPQKRACRHIQQVCIFGGKE
ncbi:PREDICTED: vacuolar protein sorting-associated protein 13B-like, partial [Tauraco erythrolophus]|uniref:vacuolar protein sorting-associated protein 13B-like n=1 Tax=Tauraco erythrolophus TaxID=121530 RepID=UPI0005231D14